MTTSEEARRETVGWVAALKKRGGSWERLPIEEARHSGPFYCPEHAALKARQPAMEPLKGEGR